MTAPGVKGAAQRLQEALELRGFPVLRMLLPLSCSAHGSFTRAYISGRLLQLLVSRHVEYSLSEWFPKPVSGRGLREGASKLLGRALLSEVADPSRDHVWAFLRASSPYLKAFCWFETAKAAAAKHVARIA